MENTLYYGDNLPVLREHIQDASVDLIYLDPPFNSNRSYNVLFADESGNRSDAQITAFDDAWHWGEMAQQTYEDLLMNAPANVSAMIGSLYKFIGANQMMAYLVMMAARLVELHRVLKPTGSLYLHCDPTASHYLKIILDTIFHVDNFKNEIVWKRTHPKGQAFTRYARNHDIILFYSKFSDKATWNSIYLNYSEENIKKQYSSIDENGRRFQLTSLLNPNPDRPNLTYEFKGVTKVWRWTKERMLEADKNGLIHVPKGGTGIPRYIRYLDEQEGIPLDDNWNDIELVSGQERLGYPTQKPLALLERIILASSNPGDVVLDPFSGCGTCISAAQKLGRKWIGIDVTHLAITMHKSRLKDMFGLEPGKDYRVVGEPADLGGACQLALEDRFQFEAWAISLVEARPVSRTNQNEPGKKAAHKGADRGMDGVITFLDDHKGSPKHALVQVKSGHIKSGDIRDLKGVLDREKAEIGIFITLEKPSQPMLVEATTSGSYHSELWNKDYPRIQILSIEELLDGAEVKLPPSVKGAYKQANKVDMEGPKQGELGI